MALLLTFSPSRPRTTKPRKASKTPTPSPEFVAMLDTLREIEAREPIAIPVLARVAKDVLARIRQVQGE